MKNGQKCTSKNSVPQSASEVNKLNYMLAWREKALTLSENALSGAHEQIKILSAFVAYLAASDGYGGTGIRIPKVDIARRIRDTEYYAYDEGDSYLITTVHPGNPDDLGNDL